MKPEWRTSTVIGICERIRQTQDYSALPILADALQDAGCDDEELLGTLRSADIPDILAEKLTALVHSEEGERAVEWMESFAPRVDQDYAEVMQTAKDYLNRGWGVTQYDAEYWRDAYYDNEGEFWKAYQHITGQAVSEDDRGSPYSCSC